MSKFIDDHKETGVEPMRRLPIAPANERRNWPPMRAPLTELEAEIKRIYNENYGVYGVRKVWKHPPRRTTGRCTVPVSEKTRPARRRPGKTWKTTKPDTSSGRPTSSTAGSGHGPNRLWVADLTYEDVERHDLCRLRHGRLLSPHPGRPRPPEDRPGSMPWRWLWTRRKT